MPITVTLPSDTKVPGNIGHVTDHNTIVDAIKTISNSAVGAIVASGDSTGATDTTNIQNALNAASPGTVVLLSTGIYYTNAPLIVPPFVTLQGVGYPGILGPNVSGHQSGYGSVIMPSTSWAQGGAGDAAVILLYGQTSGGYSAQSQQQGLYWFAIDGDNLGGTVHGVEAFDSGTASVNNVSIDRLLIRGVSGHGLYVNAGGNPLAWRVSHTSIQHCTLNGVNVSKSLTDTTWTDVYVAGSGQGTTNDGWNITTCANSQWIGCRSEGSTGNGFTYTCANSGSAGVTFLGCSTQGNHAHGFEITQTSSAPINVIGYRSNDDGNNSTGGGGFAGLYITGYDASVSVTNYMCVPGTTGASSHCPQYGLKVASLGSIGQVTINGGSLVWGYNTSYSLDGTGTVFFDASTIFMTGMGGSSPTLTFPAARLIASSATLPVPVATDDLYGAITGALAQSLPRYAVTSNTISATSGQAYFRQIILPAGITITNVVFRTGGTAKTGGTHGWYAFCDSNNKVLSVSTDQTDASTTWGTQNSDQSLAVTTDGSTKFVTAYSGVYYAVFMVAESAGTMPTFCGASSMATGIASGTPLIGGTCPGGSSTPPGVGTTLGFTAGAAADNFYAYVD